MNAGKPQEATRPPTTLSKVLVFNFFGAIKARGIPAYTAGLMECLRRVGVEAVELKAPGWVADWPPAVQNLLFVVCEQILAPLLARWHRCETAIYPYNSGSVLDAWAGRAVIVIHDLIPNQRSSKGLAARYIRMCQSWHARMGQPVATASRHTLRQLARIRQFGRCAKYHWANPFYAFEAALEQGPARRHERGEDLTILLCSGIGPNKDFRGALRLLRSLHPAEAARVRVLGFGDDAHLAERRLDLLPSAWRGRVVVLRRLSLEEIVAEFSNCDLVWVHSRAEGFGRPVIEARMCGRPVVATDIGAFRQMRRFQHLYLYRDRDFAAAMAAGMADARAGDCPMASAHGFNHQLEAEVVRLLSGAPPRVSR